MYATTLETADGSQFDVAFDSKAEFDGFMENVNHLNYTGPYMFGHTGTVEVI